MRKDETDSLLPKRLEELAKRAFHSGICSFTDFLNPAEAELAKRAAVHVGIPVFFSGGWSGAERVIACFGDEAPSEYPFRVLKVEWPKQAAPQHRDLLGSLMALGFDRSRMGDLILEKDNAWLICSAALAETVADLWRNAGRTSLKVYLSEMPDSVEPRQGAAVTGTVMSLRLDAVLAEGFGLSRSESAEIIRCGRVRLRHTDCDRIDARMEEGDIISVSGMGRLRLDSVGEETRKGRLPVRMTRYGK